MGEPRKIYNGIDLFKLIAACLVVLLHALEGTDFWSMGIKYVFTRLAVPFFFIASGFFFQRGLNRASNPRDYLIRYEKNVLKIFLVWAVIIYGPFTVAEYARLHAGEDLWYLIGTLIRRIFVIGPGPYWYLVALMWSAAFLYFCHVRKKQRLILPAILMGLILEMCYASFRGYLSQFSIFRGFFQVIYLIFSWEFNFLMFGIPFMGIGYLIAQKDCQLSTVRSAVLLAVTTVLCILEYFLPVLIPSSFWNGNKIQVAFIFQGISYFMLAKSITLNVKPQCSLCWRQLSSFIYFSHVIILYNIMNAWMDNYTTLPTYHLSLILPRVLIALSICLGCFALLKKWNNKYMNLLLNG